MIPVPSLALRQNGRQENWMVDTKNNQGICCFLSLKFPLVESHSVDKSIYIIHVYSIYSIYPKRAIHNSPKKKKMIQKRNLSVDPCSVCDPFEFRHHLSTFKVSEFQVSRRQLPTLGALLSGVEIFEKWLCPQQLTSAFQVCETETSK